MFPLKKKASNGETRNILMLIALSAALVAGLGLAYDYFTEIDYRALNDGEWKTVQVGSPYVRFECPVTLEDKSRPPLGVERDLVRRMQSFVYEDGLDLRIIVSVVDYHPHIYIDPGAVVESVKGFDRQFGAGNITYQPEELMIGSSKAIRVDGSFTKDGNKYIFTRVNTESSNNFRDLLVIVRADDLEALLVKNRMVGTISFEPQ
jgi:hypothetical protein